MKTLLSHTRLFNTLVLLVSLSVGAVRSGPHATAGVIGGGRRYRRKRGRQIHLV